jgi:hypothetical protein
LFGVRGTPDLSSAYAFGRSFSCETLRSSAYQEANQLCCSHYLQCPMTRFEAGACLTTCPTIARACNCRRVREGRRNLPTLETVAGGRDISRPGVGTPGSATRRPERALHTQNVADAVQHPKQGRQKQQARDCDQQGCGKGVSRSRGWRVLGPGAPGRGCEGLTARPSLLKQIRGVPILGRCSTACEVRRPIRRPGELGSAKHAHGGSSYIEPAIAW